MNPPTFFGSKVEEDPQEFIDEVFKVLGYGSVISRKVELAAYQLKDVTQVWYEEWKERLVREGRITWGDFKMDFLDRFFPLE